MRYKIKIIFIFYLISFFCACEKEIVDEINFSDELEVRKIDDLVLNSNDQLKLKFGRVFSKALIDSPELRYFIKEEALKRFNKDYDVMYHLVKNKPLNGQFFRSTDNTSVPYSSLRDLLLNYFDNENDLIQIESQLPLLTVFVPELPENSFSPMAWDPNDENTIPVVAIRLETTNEVPMIDIQNEYEYVLEEALIPGYPVVVIKNNERLVVDTGNHNFLKSTVLLQADNSLTYRFIDDNFDNYSTTNISFNDPVLSDTNGNSIPGNTSGCNWNAAFIPGRQINVDQFLIDAYNIFDGQVVSPWHRDNIYYQLTPTQTINNWVGGKYVEAITYFRLQGNPEQVWNIMSNQTTGSNPDPQNANTDWNRNRLAPWTDGQFEIGISVTDNSKQRGTINTTLAFDARPDQLFTYHHETVVRRRGFIIRWNRTYYKPIISGFKGMDFLDNTNSLTTLHIHPWDLREYSNLWTYEFKELDFTTEFTESSSNTRKYNTNFELTLPEIKKVGLKLGGSLEETETFSRSFKWVEGNDFLGEFDYHFDTNILNKNPCNNQLYPRLNTSTRVQVEVRPVQVQF